MAVPAQDGIGRHDTGHSSQELPTERPSLLCQPASLGIGEPDAPLAKLLAKHAVLLAEIVDDLLLLTIEPAREGQQEELEDWVEGRHDVVLARS